MTGPMQSMDSVPLEVLLLCTALSGQSAVPVPQPQMVPVNGTLRNSSGHDIDGARVQSQGHKISKTGSTDNKDFYEADGGW